MPSCRRRTRNLTESSTVHSDAQQLLQPKASNPPSGEKVMQFTAPALGSSSHRTERVATFQTLAVPSREAVPRSVPSGEAATQFTTDLWPWKVPRRSPDCTSQSLADQSREPVAKWFVVPSLTTSTLEPSWRPDASNESGARNNVSPWSKWMRSTRPASCTMLARNCPIVALASTMSWAISSPLISCAVIAHMSSRPDSATCTRSCAVCSPPISSAANDHPSSSCPA
mmetsp:Transcript_14428/g.29265  ORF Transcript_14428/g.29265 Transcript_14428/m.29265 type:complete len:227 (-) Transcript_14428:3-683(-)